MKKMFLFIVSVLATISLNAQTNVIASKSVSQGISSVNDFDDNFGDHPGMHFYNVDSVVFFPDKRIVLQYKINYMKAVVQDTFDYTRLSDDEMMKYLREIRSNVYYGDHVVFRNFPVEMELEFQKPIDNKEENSVYPFFILIAFIGGVSWLFYPRIRYVNERAS